jgi:hypothetical protein
VGEVGVVEEEGVEEDKVVDEEEMKVIEVVWFRAFCLFLCFDSSAFPCVPRLSCKFYLFMSRKYDR